MAKGFLKSILTMSVVSMVGLTGCTSEESTVMPSDNRDTSPVSNGTTDSYTGVAIDGYLRNALVWLDVDGDKKVTYCARAADDTKTDATCADEPTAITVEKGKFTLDLTDIQAVYKANQKKVLNPKEYPLMLLAIPGQTIDEDLIGDGSSTATIQKAYFLMAPAGESQITPFSTLVKIDRDRFVVSDNAISSSAPSSANAKTPQDLTNESINRVISQLSLKDNISKDYIFNLNEKIHAYAKVLVKQIQFLIPETYNNQLQATLFDDLSKGIGNPFVGDNILVIGRATLKVATNLIAVVDENVTNTSDQSEYKKVDVSSLALPPVIIKINNPMVVVKVTARRALGAIAGKKLPIMTQGLNASITEYTYNTSGTSAQKTIDGTESIFDIKVQETKKVDDKIDLEQNNSYTGIKKFSSLTKIFSYDSGGGQSIDSETSLIYTYDPQGRVDTVKNSVSKLTDTYTYNSDNKVATVTTTLSIDGSKKSKVEYTYSSTGKVLVNYKTIVSNYSNNTWVADTSSLVEYKFELVPGSITEKRLKTKIIFIKFSAEDSVVAYRWEYSYYDKSDTLKGLLEKRILNLAQLDGSAIIEPKNYACEIYEYKKLSEVAFQ